MKHKNTNPHLTRQSDVSDVYPQRFSRETVIGNHWDQTSLMSRSPQNKPDEPDKPVQLDVIGEQK